MSEEYVEQKTVAKMDIKRLIEASSNNMLSELSRDCQVQEKNEYSQADLSEIEMKEGKSSQSK